MSCRFDMKPLRPFFHFYGAKWSIGGRYPAPIHDTIIEPFAGSAGYSLRHYDRKVILVEKDPTIARLWMWLVSASPEEIRALPLMTDPEQTVSDLDVCPEAKTLIGFWIVVAVAKPANRMGGWMKKKLDRTSETWGDTFWSARMRERIATQVEAIRHWSVINVDGMCCDPEGEVAATWFVDPPYNNKAGRAYPYQVGNYEELGEWCQKRKGQVIVCEQKGATWLPFEDLGTFKSTKGKSAANGSKEMIWLGGVK